MIESQADRWWPVSVKHNWNGRSFKTYEVFSKPVPYFCTELLNERNLYHLDLQFAADSKIAAYRIRGLGISKPRWVDAKWVGLEKLGYQTNPKITCTAYVHASYYHSKLVEGSTEVR